MPRGAQYYFETIFPRIPKPVQDDFVSKLTAMGLPSRAVGNAGQGGHDRRGIEEANRRPASVKASLCARALPLLGTCVPRSCLCSDVIKFVREILCEAVVTGIQATVCAALG